MNTEAWRPGEGLLRQAGYSDPAAEQFTTWAARFSTSLTRPCSTSSVSCVPLVCPSWFICPVGQGSGHLSPYKWNIGAGLHHIALILGAIIHAVLEKHPLPTTRHPPPCPHPAPLLHQQPPSYLHPYPPLHSTLSLFCPHPTSLTVSYSTSSLPSSISEPSHSIPAPTPPSCLLPYSYFPLNLALAAPPPGSLPGPRQKQQNPFSEGSFGITEL